MILFKPVSFCFAYRRCFHSLGLGACPLMAGSFLAFSQISRLISSLNYGFLHRRIFVTTPRGNASFFGEAFTHVGAVTH